MFSSMKSLGRTLHLRALSCIWALAGFLSAPAANACIWIDGVDLHGHPKDVIGGTLMQFTPETLRKLEWDRQSWQSYAEELAEKSSKSPSARTHSNYAGALLHLREFERARDILLEAERNFPGDYAVAANLGTAFELLGNNESALHWIQIGTSRNPDSHHGTEWVHVKILQAKIAAVKDPSWLKHHSVVGANFGTEAIPQWIASKSDSSESKTDPLKLIRAIGYQLKERLEFVSPPDPYVGDLLFDLGNAMAVSEAVNIASELYAMAQQYQAPKAELVSTRLALAQDLVKTAAYRKTRNQVLLGALVVGVGCLLIYVLRRVRRNRRVLRIPARG
jgi:hypothetical protein